MPRHLASGLAVFFLACVPACSAQLTGTNDPAKPGQPTGTGGAASAGAGPWQPGDNGDPQAAGVLPLRILTRAELDNTITLIFQDEYGLPLGDLHAAASLPGEVVDLTGFLNVGEITEENVLRYMDVADKVVLKVAPALPKVMGCDVAAADASACVKSFVQTFGALLYRRPLADDEVNEHLAFFEKERAELGADAPTAAARLLKAMLQAPYFLYRWEQGWVVPEHDAKVARLNSYQVASRLAFFLWGSGPDRALLAQAKAGTLTTPEQIAASARAMLQSPRAEQALASFHSQWLGLNALDMTFKDPTRFPQWNDALRASMQDEVQAFTRDTLLHGDGTVATLLGGSYSFLNEALAKIYGVAGVAGTELRRVDLDPNQRAGLLTMPALLAATSEPSTPNPFKRGKLLLEKILCRKLEPPPTVPALPVPDATNPQPERQVLETMTAGQPCATCHQQINPLGFGLSNFDAIGQFQTQDRAGFPIDAAGKLPTGEAFSTPRELAAALAANPEVLSCVTKQWFRFGFGRPEDAADKYSLGTAYASFQGASFNVRELLVSLVTSRSFLNRQIEAGEVLQ